MKDKNKLLSILLIGALFLIIVLLIILLVIVINKKDSSLINRANFITREEALNRTLNDVNLNLEDISEIEVELKTKYAKDVYEINFKYNGYEYEYYVDAKTKEIIRSFKDIDDDLNNNQSSNNQTSNNNQSNNQSSNNSKEYLSKDEAINIALNHAGINKNDVYDLSIELDYKYGKEVYEIDFNYQKYEYEYNIDALNGNIIHSFKEIDF